MIYIYIYDMYIYTYEQNGLDVFLNFRNLDPRLFQEL